MQKSYLFKIPGEPCGKQRPRITRRGSYTPQKTVEYELRVREAFYAKYPDAQPIAQMDRTYLLQPLELIIDAYFSIPKSYQKGKLLAAQYNQILPTKRPDADNICKIVADALNGHAYTDDAQVVRAVVNKRYTRADGHVDVYVGEYEYGSDDSEASVI